MGSFMLALLNLFCLLCFWPGLLITLPLTFIYNRLNPKKDKKVSIIDAYNNARKRN